MANGKTSPYLIFYNTSNRYVLNLSKYTGSQTINVTFGTGTTSYFDYSENGTNIKYITVKAYNGNTLVNKAQMKTGSAVSGRIYLTTTFDAGDYQNNGRTLYIELTDS
jgi:hypothetical protein